MSKTLIMEHKGLLIEWHKDLYKLDMSYVLFKIFTMDIPLPVLYIYKLVPTPLRLLSHPHLFSLHPYWIHMAVGDPKQRAGKQRFAGEQGSKESILMPSSDGLGF